MTTNFQAATPPAAPASGATSFQAAGEPNAPADTAPDTEAVVEIGGRKLTRTDIATALKRLDDSQNFIGTLKEENQRNTEALNKAVALLEKAATTQDLLNKAGQQPAAPAPGIQPAAPVDPNAVADLVHGRIKADSQKAIEESNWVQITTALTEAFGDQTNAKVSAVAKETGYTLAEMEVLAKTKPQAFRKLFPELASVKMKPGATFNPTANSQAHNQQQTPQTGAFAKARSQREMIDIVNGRFKAALAASEER